MPFLPIRRAGTHTLGGIAYHIKQTKEFERAFDSHGCMRMQEKDLYELYAIAAHQGADAVPVQVQFTVDLPSDHPMPPVETAYWAVVNCAKKGHAPASCLDKDGLTLMRLVSGAPPASSILASSKEVSIESLLKQDFMGEPMPPADDSN
jgi:hypothetical protein